MKFIFIVLATNCIVGDIFNKIRLIFKMAVLRDKGKIIFVVHVRALIFVDPLVNLTRHKKYCKILGNSIKANTKRDEYTAIIQFICHHIRGRKQKHYVNLLLLNGLVVLFPKHFVWKMVYHETSTIHFGNIINIVLHFLSYSINL